MFHTVALVAVEQIQTGFPTQDTWKNKWKVQTKVVSVCLDGPVDQRGALDQAEQCG